MTRLVLSLMSASLLLGAASSAHAVAHHKIEAVQKIVKKGALWGARVHLLVDPETYKKYRINVAPQRELTEAQKANDTTHRKTLAGATGKFVLKTLKTDLDVTGLQEIFVDIPYGKGIQAGAKVNVLSAFTNGPDGFKPSSNQHMHIFGAWDGPMNQGDATYIVTLPTAESDAPKATKNLAQKQ